VIDLFIVPRSEFDRVRRAPLERYSSLALFADMCRLNTLAAVKRAGSGHLGSSFSAMDLVTYLYLEVLNVRDVGLGSPDRDVYFSSKGHDVPGLYAVLFALGVLTREQLLALRRFGGLDGHPDLHVPGIEANSGSLGMGISKGKGMAWAKRHLGLMGEVFVLTGDGELQEGQVYEALLTARQQRLDNLTVIVDHNKVQSDRPVAEIVAVNDLAATLSSFGWQVARCDGHDLRAVEASLARMRAVGGGPRLLIADTIKGKGVSFMEHPRALTDGGGLYAWHAGAPDDQAFTAAFAELRARVDSGLSAAGLPALEIVSVDHEATASPGEPTSEAARQRVAPVTSEYVSKAFGEELLDLAATHPEIVVLDADLAADCKIRGFERAHPGRFIENGIAEQDMVSTAAGLARFGLLPVVNSFAAFLAARANEQIYNAASEGGRIVYALHYAGLIPAGPGKSHQSIRDVSLLAALPNIAIVQPANAEETRQAVRWAVEEATEGCALRLVIGPSPRLVELPAGYRLRLGRGAVLRPGDDAAMVAYGPVMLHEALDASERLEREGIGLRVVNMPWLNRFDAEWLSEALGGARSVWVIEDHSPIGGLADRLLPVLLERGLLPAGGLRVIGVEGFPACGTPAEALAFHGLDDASLASRVRAELKGIR
jgi:transketolase